MKIDYRLYSDTDINQLVNFWNQNSGWDIIDRQEWERRFLNTPYGEASVVIAENKKSNRIGASVTTSDIFYLSQIENGENILAYTN